MAIAACVTEPNARNPRCWYPGDTIAMLGPIADSTNVMRCVWIVADHVSCLLPQEPGRAGTVTASDCVIPSERISHG